MSLTPGDTGCQGTPDLPQGAWGRGEVESCSAPQNSVFARQSKEILILRGPRVNIFCLFVCLNVPVAALRRETEGQIVARGEVGEVSLQPRIFSAPHTPDVLPTCGDLQQGPPPARLCPSFLPRTLHVVLTHPNLGCCCFYF